MSRRSGTENIAGIAGFGAACAAAKTDLERYQAVQQAQERIVRSEKLKSLGYIQ